MSEDDAARRPPPRLSVTTGRLNGRVHRMDASGRVQAHDPEIQDPSPAGSADPQSLESQPLRPQFGGEAQPLQRQPWRHGSEAQSADPQPFRPDRSSFRGPLRLQPLAPLSGAEPSGVPLVGYPASAAPDPAGEPTLRPPAQLGGGQAVGLSVAPHVPVRAEPDGAPPQAVPVPPVASSVVAQPVAAARSLSSALSAAPGRLDVKPLPSRSRWAGPMAKATGSSVPAGLEHWTRREIVEECRTALAAIGGWTLASIGVTSSLRGEGRSTIAAASALVERYTYCRRTVLVELDLESPSLAGTLGLQAGPGVVQVLSGKASLENCIQWADDDLGVLVAGHPGDGPSAPERSLPISQLMRSLDALCEAVIVDLPPLLPTGLPAELAAGCSSIVLVVRAGAAPLHDIRRAVAALDRPPPVILNRIGSKGPAWLDNMLGGRR